MSSDDDQSDREEELDERATRRISSRTQRLRDTERVDHSRETARAEGAADGDRATTAIFTPMARDTPAPVTLEIASKALIEQEGRYAPRGSIGKGGMGEVRLSHDRRIGRDVAMKVIRASYAKDELVRARFEREARVQGQLEHPSVVPVYDLGLDDEGRLFFTMKRVRGRTLSDIIDRQRLRDREVVAAFSRRRLLTAFSQLCLAVAFAHSRGVLHRDLKPDNVMLGDYGEVHLLDWGIATVLEDLRATDEKGETGKVEAQLDVVEKTTEGEAVGTPGYMAPEQVLGLTELIDARADVFALGALLFEILTLHPLVPFGAMTEMNARTLAGVDARTSVRYPDAAVPPELEAICVRATALRDERIASARDLHAEIERFLDGDRDLEQRKALAAACVDRAIEATKAGRAEGTVADADRARAMKELTAALALNPEEPRAARLLGTLLVEGPQEMPPAARQAFEQTRQLGRTSMRRTVFYATLAYPFVALALALLGILEPRLYAAVLVSSAMCPVVAGWSLKLRDDPQSPFVLLCTVMATTATFVLVAGPLVLLPSMAGAATVAFVSLGGDKLRRPAIVFGLATILVPLLLQLLGVLPSSYRFDGGGMHLVPRVTAFPEATTLAVLVVASVASMLSPVILVLRTQRFVRELEERTFLHAWNLRKLIPDSADVPPLVPARKRRRVR